MLKIFRPDGDQNCDEPSDTVAASQEDQLVQASEAVVPSEPATLSETPPKQSAPVNSTSVVKKADTDEDNRRKQDAEKRRRMAEEKKRREMEERKRQQCIKTAYERYLLPPTELLPPPAPIPEGNTVFCESTKDALNCAFQDYGFSNQIIGVKQGPRFTLFETKLECGQRLSSLQKEKDNLAFAIGCDILRVQPVPEVPSTIYLEVENPQTTPVSLRECLECNTYQRSPSRLAFVLGKNIDGTCMAGDIAQCAHLLIAGATGTGKTVCLDVILLSILFRARPSEVKFLLIGLSSDPLSGFHIPHQIVPTATDKSSAIGALKWAVSEVQRRHELLSMSGNREISKFNDIQWESFAPELEQIVIVIDGIEQLFLDQHCEVFQEIQSLLLQILRNGQAVGIHLVATVQAISAYVLPESVRAAFPSKISFATADARQSRAVLDCSGAEGLAGTGEMLYRPRFTAVPVRVQGCDVSQEEMQVVISHINTSLESAIAALGGLGSASMSLPDEIPLTQVNIDSSDNLDELFPQAVSIVLETGIASVSMLQRRLKLGYTRASHLIAQMEENGVVGPFEDSKPRKILITKEQWQERR